jgi:hypothetical protein
MGINARGLASRKGAPLPPRSGCSPPGVKPGPPPFRPEPAAAWRPERTKGMHGLIIDNALGLAFICGYLCWQECRRLFTGRKRRRTLPKKVVRDNYPAP